MIQTQINDKELLEKLDNIEADGMSIFVMAEGRYRGALFNGTKFINQMRANHNLGILETMVLGQAYICAALMIPTIKGRGRLTFRYDTNGPAAGFNVEADSLGTVRGYLLQNPIPISAPLESWDLAPFFGPGTLTISRISPEAKVPQIGSVEIKHKNIAQDLAWYFQQSEQTQTAFNTSIQFDKAGRVIGAGGMFLQRLPSTGGKIDRKESIDEEELVEAVEHAFSSAPSYGQWFAEKGNREDIIYGLFRAMNPSVVLDRDIVFDCPCSEEKYTNAIKNLGKEEVQDIILNDPDPIEVICHNCGSVYNISKKSLTEE
ncbi:MAG: Hsp33 family molecular chaperone HslO [Spirochaetaceae bacterium]|nr:Hsp33 family molecular chaperone HslO [Spirochaetaceae bacterium]